MGSFKARMTRALKLPITPGRSRCTLKLTLLEDVFRMATVSRVVSHALVGQIKFTVPRYY
jgi:hypothetical protein